MSDDLSAPPASPVGPAPQSPPALDLLRGPTATPPVVAAQASRLHTALDLWPVMALIASAAMLAGAHAFETFGKLYPCLLCLRQREVYWVAGTVALIALAARRSPWAAQTRRPFDLLLAAIFLYGAGLAAFHAGVEWKWWPGPTACAAGQAAAAGDLVAMLKGGAVKAPSCDKPAWIFLGLSMAGWNALVSLGLAAASLASGLRKPERAS